MPLTDEQTNRLVDWVTNEVQAGNMSPEAGRAYVTQTLHDAQRLSNVVRDTPVAPVDHAAGFVAPDPTQIAVTLLQEQGLSRAQITARLQGSGLDGLTDAIAQRQAELQAKHVAVQEAIAQDSPDTRRAQAAAELKAAEDLKRDGVLARQFVVSQGILPPDAVSDLTDAEAIGLAFHDDPRDAEANDLGRELGKGELQGRALDVGRRQAMTGLHVGQLLNLAISRSRSQERIEPPVVRFTAYRVVLNTETANYKPVQTGFLTAVQTHRKVSPQRFGEKREVTAESFELICASEEFAAEWRDRDVVRAAVQWCRVNSPRGLKLNVVNDALLAVLASAHGCPAAGGPTDFNLMRAGSYLERKPVESSAVESTAVESNAAA